MIGKACVFVAVVALGITLFAALPVRIWGFPEFCNYTVIVRDDGVHAITMAGLGPGDKQAVKLVRLLEADPDTRMVIVRWHLYLLMVFLSSLVLVPTGFMVVDRFIPMTVAAQKRAVARRSRG